MTHRFSFSGATYHCRRRRFWRGLWIPLLVVFLFVLLSNLTLRPRMEAIVNGLVRNRISSLAASVLYETLSDKQLTYDSFIHLSHKSDGGIAAMGVDTILLNRVLCQILLQLKQSIGEERQLEMHIPLGTLLGVELLTGRGPQIPVIAQVTEGIRGYFTSSFTDVGINQTQHTVRLRLEFYAAVLYGTGHCSLELQQDFPAAQTILLGEVPGTYTEINHLTEPVSDGDIDDIVDFGNIMG